MAIELPARPEAQNAPAGPTRSPYRFRLLRFVDWREVGFLPLRNVTISWKRGDVGRIDASLALTPGAPVVRPAEHLLVVEQDGDPIWGGMVWAVDWSTGMAYATLRGSEWSGMLKRRRIRRDMNFSQMDQFDIARSLVLEAQGLALQPSPRLSAEAERAANLHIDAWQGLGVEAPMSGVLRDRTYLGIERPEVYQKLAQLSQVINGFDWYLRPRYRQDSLVFWLVFDYPPGERQSELVLEYRRGWSGSSVVDYGWPWDGTAVTNRAEAANDEEIQTAEDPGAWSRYPLLEALVSQGGEHGATRSETLLEHAQAYLLEERLPRVGGRLTLRSDLRVGPEIVGSRVRFRASSWRHPPAADGSPGLDQELVVNEVQMNLPSDERPLTTQLTVESLHWQMGEGGRARGFRGGSGRITEAAELPLMLRDARIRQELAQGEVRRLTAALSSVEEEVGIAPPPPPTPEPPPQPPPIQTFEVLYNSWGNLGQRGGNAEVAAANFAIPRNGSVRIQGGITLQPIQWNNNEGMGRGTRWVSFIIAWMQSSRQMVGGSSPNWAQNYQYFWDEWWAFGSGGGFTARFWLDIGGGNQLVIKDGWYRLTFHG